MKKFFKKRPLNWITLFWYFSNILIFLYAMSKMYSNLTINGADFGIFFRYIRAIPGILVLLIYMIADIFLQQFERNKKTTLNDVIKGITDIPKEAASQGILLFYLKFLWRTVIVGLLKATLLFIASFILIIILFGIYQILMGIIQLIINLF